MILVTTAVVKCRIVAVGGAEEITTTNFRRARKCFDEKVSSTALKNYLKAFFQ